MYVSKIHISIKRALQKSSLTQKHTRRSWALRSISEKPPVPICTLRRIYIFTIDPQKSPTSHKHTQRSWALQGTLKRIGEATCPHIYIQKDTNSLEKRPISHKHMRRTSEHFGEASYQHIYFQKRCIWLTETYRRTLYHVQPIAFGVSFLQSQVSIDNLDL